MNLDLNRCPVDQALEIIGGKWKPLILWRLSAGTLRFGQLQRAIPQVTQRMLTLQSRELERAGLVLRTVYPEVPPKVEYALTDLGPSVVPVLASLGQWFVEHHADLREASSSAAAQDLEMPREHPVRRSPSSKVHHLAGRSMLRSLICLLALLVGGSHAARAADDTSLRASVECEFAGSHSFPFSAGRDRCWDAINGKTMAPKTVIACAVQRSDGTLSVTFHFSESLKPECDNSKVATREQYSRAVPLLGQKERSFFLSHVDSK